MIIDAHAHYEPGLLDLEDLIKRMDERGIHQTALISRVTDTPVYRKSDLMMGIQRFIMQRSYLRPFAKMLDDSFHGTKGEWNPWFRKVLGKPSVFRILLNPDNQSVADAVRQYPHRLMGWIFLNPLVETWEEEFDRWVGTTGMIGVKVHPFWHRYSVSQLDAVAQKTRQKRLPLLIHLGFDDLRVIERFCLKFPDLNVIFAHAGVPFYGPIWTIIKRSPNKYVDFSSHHVDARIIKDAVDVLGPERCLFGTDDPYGDPQAGVIIKAWIEDLPLGREDKEKILARNFLRLVGDQSLVNHTGR